MRISEQFGLGRSQSSLDFVDVDNENDTPVFVSPRALSILPSAWGDECVHLVQDFFSAVLQLIKSGNQDKAEALLGSLREPNETHLGLSRGRSRGRALGDSSAHEVWRALSQSAAAKSGLIQDLEETVLMVDGISVDIVSDMTTNIIRQPLIRYTQQQCEYHGIPTHSVDSGPLWDPTKTEWFSEFVSLPVTSYGKLLLIPKIIVRQHSLYDPGEYYRNYLLKHLRAEEFRANSSLVELLKNKKRRVTSKRLMEKYGRGKRTIVRETLKRPHILEEYRQAKDANPNTPLTLREFSDLENSTGVDWNGLLSAVVNLPSGTDAAGQYEKAVEALLTALFYPNLVNPVPQHKLHNGRKRVDITYTNAALDGFFAWVAKHYPAAHVFVECKNYESDPANPELDQLSGRFSPSRGMVGLLVCRKLNNRALFSNRCRDTALDQRGYIIALDDDDLRELVDTRLREGSGDQMSMLQVRFRALVS